MSVVRTSLFYVPMSTVPVHCDIGYIARVCRAGARVVWNGTCCVEQAQRKLSICSAPAAGRPKICALGLSGQGGSVFQAALAAA